MSENHAGHMPSSGRALSISAWLTGVYFIVELGIGLWTGSVAVISDAFHTSCRRQITSKFEIRDFNFDVKGPLLG